MSAIAAASRDVARCLKADSWTTRKPLIQCTAKASAARCTRPGGVRFMTTTTTLPPSESRSHDAISIPAPENRTSISSSTAGSSSSQTAVELAKTLPPSLIEFFRRFPPSDSYAIGPQRPSPLSGTPKAEEILLASTPLSDPTYNPFQTWKNPVTGRWRPPMFSLRRQAELVKKAMNYGVAELLPHTNKLPWVKAQKREEQGLRVKGTGVGQKVKGKEWERTVKGRLEKRRRAMLEMPKLVQQWKERGHGRGWKKWPK